jgi:hypothetical protein
MMVSTDLKILYTLFFIVVLSGASTEIPTIYKYIILEFMFSFLYIRPHSPIPGIVTAGIIFPLTYMYAQYLHHIHPPTPFPYLLLLPMYPPPSHRKCSALLFSDFIKIKSDIIIFILV